MAVCPKDAIEPDAAFVKTNRNLCDACGQCTNICPNDARIVVGKEMSSGEVFREVSSDKIFYQESDGGVTLSGGEAFSQPEFSMSILELCKKDSIHTAVETCGYGPWSKMKEVLDYTDLVLFDFKHMDDNEHKKFTGVSNKMILDNAKRILFELRIPMIARIPVIPGYNDSEENMARTAEFMSHDLNPSVKVELLPYHRMGEGKLINLEKKQDGFSSSPPAIDHLNKLKSIFVSYGLTVSAGG
jgi:pyruvate formate lyase activating enzyme